MLRFGDEPWCTSSQLHLFERFRRDGAITVFRTGTCACGKEIPKGKKFCSKVCWAAAQEKK
jgi:hypothetical protein